jgi:hypothetical protein
MAISRCLVDDARNNDTVLPVRMQVKPKGIFAKSASSLRNYLLPAAIGPTHRQVSHSPSGMHHTIVNGESTLSTTPDFGTLSEDRRLRSYRVENVLGKILQNVSPVQTSIMLVTSGSSFVDPKSQ